jgi:putative flippase GtrA
MDQTTIMYIIMGVLAIITVVAVYTALNKQRVATCIQDGNWVGNKISFPEEFVTQKCADGKTNRATCGTKGDWTFSGCV